MCLREKRGQYGWTKREDECGRWIRSKRGNGQIMKGCVGHCRISAFPQVKEEGFGRF